MSASPLPTPEDRGKGHPRDVLGSPPAREDSEAWSSWHKRLIEAPALLRDPKDKMLAEFFRLLIEVPEARRRWNEIVRENDRQDAVEQLLRDTRRQP